jgi:hypothetical protein
MSRAAMAKAILSSTEADYFLLETFYMEFLHRQASMSELSGFVMNFQQGMSQQQIIGILIGSGEYLNVF